MSESRDDPSKETLELARAIDRELAADIEKQSVYVSPSLCQLRVRDDGLAISYVIEAGGDRAALRDKVVRFVADMASKHRKLARKVAAKHERRAGAPAGVGTYDELVRRRWVLPLGRGQVGLAGPALSLVRALDEECRSLGLSSFGAREESYPALIPADVLGACGYFASFPQAVSFVAHLIEDYDAIERFRVANATTDVLVIPEAASIPTPEACLVPAVCYHCYQSLAGLVLGAEGHVATASGKCFRYESSNIVGLDRLWDFTMREVIFVGDAESVLHNRARAIEQVAEQLARWDLSGTIETANDPFFPTTYAAKTYYQVRSDLKLELRLEIDRDTHGAARTLACGSFNLHEDFFGKTFDIKTADGAFANTGCVGWGLERWVLACFSQHGFSPDGWPSDLRSKVFA